MDVQTVIGTVIAIALGIMLTGNLLIPAVEDVLSSSYFVDSDGNALHSDWASMINIVVIASLIGLIAVALYSFKSKN